MKLCMLIVGLTLISMCASAPAQIDLNDIPWVKIVMALETLDDSTIKAYGIDPSVLLFRDQLKAMIPAELLQLAQQNGKF